jgi:hypothetical protein
MKHIPNTDSIFELAEFWQAHDITDFESELEEVTTPVFQHAPQAQIVLSVSDAQAVRTRARQAQISESELVARWVHERLGTVACEHIRAAKTQAARERRATAIAEKLQGGVAP